MKKFFFYAVTVVMASVIMTSCSSEELSSETFNVNKKENVLYVDEATETTVASTEGTGSVRQWTMSDGQIVNARYDGAFDAQEINIVKIDEARIDENRMTVYVDVEARSTSGGKMTRSVSYDKIVRNAEEPTPDDPIIPAGPSYKVETDTTMLYGSLGIRMKHIATLITTYEDGRVEKEELSSKVFVVCEFSRYEHNSTCYTQCVASDVKVSTYLDDVTTENSVDGYYTIEMKKGEQKFAVDFIGDSGYALQKVHGTLLTERSVSFNYDDDVRNIHVHEAYPFTFKCEKASEKVIDAGIEDEYTSEHLYHYVGSQVTTFNLSLNGYIFDQKSVVTNVMKY